jgi:hypothetical protein
MLPPGGRRPHEAPQTGFNTRLESHLNPTIHPYARVSRRPLRWIELLWVELGL